MIRNADSNGRWRQDYFAAAVRDELKDASVWGDNEEVVYTSSEFQRHSLDRALHGEINSLYTTMQEMNPELLQVRISIALDSDDDRVDLDAPGGKLPTAFREILDLEDDRITTGDKIIQPVGYSVIHKVWGTRWALDGRRLVVRTSNNNDAVDATFDVTVVYVPPFTPINLDSKLPYYGMPAESHHVIAEGAAKRLMSPEDPAFDKLRERYAISREELLRSQASLSSAMGNMMRAGEDFSMAR